MYPEHELDVASVEDLYDFRAVKCLLACVAGVLFVMEILLIG